MNPITTFFVQNIIAVFFVYGLAFFSTGLALLLASRRTSQFQFIQAIRPLAAFGILHGINEWMEMFRQVAGLEGTYTLPLWYEVTRVVILVLSFVMLFRFGLLLLLPEGNVRRRAYFPMLAMVGIWGVNVLLVQIVYRLPLGTLLTVGDVLSRYILAVPAALFGTWALFKQQRTFRQHQMPQFGRDLFWCATALFGYGVLGQVFVRQTFLFPSNVVNSTLFLQIFGVPVQLFRAIMAVIIAIFMVRALNVFELEHQHQLEEANRAKLKAQMTIIEAERRINREKEHLNKKLRLKAHELSILLEVSNLLAVPMRLQAQLQRTLELIVHSLKFSDAGMILLVERESGDMPVRAATGLMKVAREATTDARYSAAVDVGEQCVRGGKAICQHQDGLIIEFALEEALDWQTCQHYSSPVAALGLPLATPEAVIGSIVLVKAEPMRTTGLSVDEFRLMVGMAQQLGLSIENARLRQEALRREERLAELLHQVVGAQEAERQRIARELHDATGQSLTAIGLGLRSVETMLKRNPTVAIEHLKELKAFSGNALGELRGIIANLRPSHLDDLGLVAALKWYIQRFERRYTVSTNLIVTGEPLRLPDEYETVLFRIAQEALTNVAKHAHASQATIELEFSTAQISLTITDDGSGFDPRSILWRNGEYVGWGLLGIRERAALLRGTCQFDSSPGEGTRVFVNIPFIRKNQDVKNKVIAG